VIKMLGPMRWSSLLTVGLIFETLPKTGAYDAKMAGSAEVGA
jgi:hypothetical protein